VTRIDYYYAAISPWCHMAGRRPAEIAARHGADLVYRPVDPSALFARTGGKVLAERHPARQAYRLQELERWSRHLGLPLNIRPRYFPVNPAPSAYALIAAQEAGGGDIHALATGLTRACWEEDRDISDDAVIGDCLEAAGFSRGLTMTGLLSGANSYGRNLEHAVMAGVFGVPFLVVGEAMFWGQDRLDFLDAHLQAQA